ncbi:hypothetical protein F8B91_16255 [Aestuariivirga litoralis]|nr:hypothetical protein [Aestuariivirga litoralis]
MSLGALNAKYRLETVSIWLMVLGVVALCQPLSKVVHEYGVGIILLGLIGFNIFSKVKPPETSGE